MVEADAFEAADRLNAGYADMTDDAKAVYDAEFLKWVKAVFEQCADNEDGIACRKADEIRTSEEAARLTGDYYNSDASARETADAAQADANAQQKATLTAAWIADNKPEAGELGSSCSATAKCTGANHCCGTGIPSSNAAGVTAGQVEGMCGDKTTKVYTDALGIAYNHTCGAQKIIATVTALFTAAFFM